MVIIEQVDERPFHTIPYRFPRTGCGAAQKDFPLFRATARGMPTALAGLLVLSDLQGREPSQGDSAGPGRLLGEALADECALLAEVGAFPAGDRIGVVLGGDLFVAEDLGKRGGKGDVRWVWRAFREHFRWVAGVAGNHDRFGDDPKSAFSDDPRIHWLDAESVMVVGLRIGGVGGIIGNPIRPFRRTEPVFLATIKRVMVEAPDVLVLHEGPSGPARGGPGNDRVRSLLERLPPTLVVCGHDHWSTHAAAILANGTQILNAEGRGYLIHPA